ncbi:hypothetical protein BCR43DRAFT_491835 [Syncephalastrum racemosum]|uniref:Tetratricopeptide repeat-domain-containing protein n=1 Tax=Syncephalastrum racemosum TaxID=13706 RepID=A0A1X2HCK4_SYNRA|nr:hypothetical protein BCR43DRAFT_491835 [Syncephalastrum racemosum]
MLSDDTVLDLIFNPESQGKPPTELPRDEPVTSIPSERLEELKKMENKAVSEAEAGRTEKALNLLNQCIRETPEYLSAYNNRAQVHRLMKNDDLALVDLDTVIAQGQKQPSLLRQAYTHRGILRRHRGDAAGAQKDFEMGAKYGNPIARNIAVQENPYAKMCNQIMMEVMGRQLSGAGPSQ